MRKKVMVLGAGRGQLPIIDIYQDLGCEVIAVSPKGNYPGFEKVDKAYYYDVQDKAAVLEVAEKEKIEAITTDQLDAGVLTAAYVAEKLEIPGIGYDVALKFTNKSIMKKEAKKLGVKVPEFYEVNNKKDAIKAANKIGYPIIMKPTDSAASRGVYKVNCEQEISREFTNSKKYSQVNTVLIEEYVTGIEYCVESFTQDFKVKNLIIGHRDYFDIPNMFIPNASVFIDAESANTDVEKRILTINKTLVQGFGLNFGITHGEFLYDESRDEIFLVEIAARGGGVFISSDLIPLGSGINAIKLLVENSIGIKSDLSTLPIKTASSAYYCYLLPQGEVTKIQNVEKLDNIKGVHKAFFDNVALGMDIPSAKDKSSRKGPILVAGKSKEDCYDIIEQVKNQLKIEVRTPNGIVKGIQW